MKIIFVKPEKDELDYRVRMIESITKNPNEAMPESLVNEYDNWYDKWVGNPTNEYYYAFIKDEDENKYIGEVAYHINGDDVRISIIVDNENRGKGYANIVVPMLLKKIFDQGVTVITDYAQIDDLIKQKLFMHYGFKSTGSTDDKMQFKMTYDDYLYKYEENE